MIRGNPSKRPLPENEPKPQVSKPKAPPHLSEGARKHWRVVVKQLADAGVMTHLDRDALEAYCESYALWVDAQAKLSEFGPVVKDRFGAPKVSPYMQIAREAFAQMRSMLAEFGMTPAARTRVSTAAQKPKEKSDPWSDL